MTIKDLAQKTGYSVATVSRVLNNHPRVSPKAREEISRAVEESGFQINANAKQLKQHSNSILVIVKGTANEMFSEMLETIQSLVAQTQYPLYVDYIDEDSNEVLRAVRLRREKKPLGILETMWVWNDYLLPYLVLDRKKFTTVPILIQYFKGSFGRVEMGPMMACIMLTVLPIIVVYLICQKHIIKGVVAGAVKG